MGFTLFCWNLIFGILFALVGATSLSREDTFDFTREACCSKIEATEMSGRLLWD